MRIRKQQMNLRRAAVVSMVVCALVASACGGDSESGSEDPGTDGPTTTAAAGEEATPVPGGKLIYGIDSDTDGWSPASNRWVSAGLNIARAVYDPLAAFDADGRAQPYLAESIEPNEDFTVWTITMRPDVTFHNGDPLTAEVVAANLDAVRASALIGPSLKLIESIETTGPLELVITMSAPWSSFPVLIAQQPGFIVHPTMLSGDVTEPLGTGPFVFAEWVPGDHLTVERNPEYWRSDAAGAQLPYLNEIEFRIISETITRDNAIETRDVDVMHTASPASLVSYGADLDPGEGRYAVSTPESDDEMFIALNSQTGSTDQPAFREALALATNRELLNDSLYEGFFEIANAPYASDSKWYTDPGWPEYDPDAAAAMIDQLEAEGGDTSVTLAVVSGTEFIELGQAVAEQWEAVGVDVQIDSLDATTLTLDMVTGNYEASIISLFNAPDPDGDYHFWDSTNITAPGEFSLDFSRYQSTTMKEAMDAARRTNDDAARAEEWARVWAEIADKFPVIWLWHTQFVIVAYDDVHGIETFTLPDGSPTQVVNWGSVFLTEAWIG